MWIDPVLAWCLIGRVLTSKARHVYVKPCRRLGGGVLARFGLFMLRMVWVSRATTASIPDTN